MNICLIYKIIIYNEMSDYGVRKMLLYASLYVSF